MNYYDDYNNFDKAGFTLPSNTVSNVKGLLTSNQTRVLNTNDWITTLYGYDAKGRLIWSGSYNSYLNTRDVVETTYDFLGRVVETVTTHTKASNAAITTTERFTYDHAGRVIKHTHQVNNQAEELIAENDYDEIGQLVEKKVGNTSANPLQTINYSYNIRGWQRSINEVNNLGTDLFAMQMSYNDANNPLFNGNISKTTWQSNNADKSVRGYDYTYDALNRITDAIGTTTNNYDLYDVTYDKMGNIQTLKRRGHTNLAANSFGIMDNLIYDYDDGNKLKTVNDTGNSVYGFKNGANSAVEYTYDANGNMLTDTNKGITNITYNYLNLPTQVTLANGTISYIYDAEGTKLKKTVNNNTQNSVTSTEYAGNYTYLNNLLKFFNTSEGYVEKGGTGNFLYVYSYKDHLSNIRLFYSDNNDDGSITLSEIRKENHYYPFGLQHRGYNTSISGNEYIYGFGNTEKQDELNLKWYDFGARNYDAALGRWMNFDPMSEFMRAQSNYNFAFNNPIYYSDKYGFIPWPVPELFNNLKRRLGSPFGPRNCKGCSKFHKGIDINFGSGDDDFGAPVLATHSGKVIKVNNDIKSSGGRYVKIKSFNGAVQTRYLHLGSINVKEGDEIEEGTTIGYIGGSGRGKERGYAVHLHYELYLDSKRSNPQDSSGNLIDPQNFSYPKAPEIPRLIASNNNDWLVWHIGMKIWHKTKKSIDKKNKERIAKSILESRGTAEVTSAIKPAGAATIPSTSITPGLVVIPIPQPNPTPIPDDITPSPCIDC